MKTPYRYLIGIAVGLAVGFLLNTNEIVSSMLAETVDLAIRLSRYLLLPLIFFSLPVAVTKLRRLGVLGPVLRRSSLAVLISSAVLTVIGTLIAWLAGSGRIPVVPGTLPEASAVTLGTLVRNTFPLNSFRIFTGESSFLLPLLIPAFLLGWHMYHDREIAEPAFNFFDSMSRILYRANRYVLLLMPGLLAVLTAAAVAESRGIVEFRRFLPLLGTVLLAALVLIAGIYPLILWLAYRRHSPWKALAGISGALLSALVSGSPLFNYGNLIRHLKENLNIPRHSAALIAPVYLMFARAGTAMVTAFCMMTVIRSYSSLEITLFQAAWTALFSFLVSFALPASPDRGLATALVILSGLYGRGLEDGWLILAPVLPLLMMITTMLDTATGALLLLLVNRKSGLEEENAAAAVRF